MGGRAPYPRGISSSPASQQSTYFQLRHEFDVLQREHDVTLTELRTLR